MDQFSEHRYSVNATKTTSTGMHVDTSGLSVDVQVFDKQADEADQCVFDLVGGKDFTVEQRKAFQCDNRPFAEVCRDCFYVKVAPNAFLSMDKTQELLPAVAPGEGCVAKGLCNTAEECSCHWRAGLQVESSKTTIVVTPSGYLFKQYYLMMAYGCLNIWTEGMSQCATPSISPLSGLVN